MLILILSLVFEFPTRALFLDKFGTKNSKLFVLPKNRHMGYLEDADSCCSISFLNFQPKSILGQICTANVKQSINNAGIINCE